MRVKSKVWINSKGKLIFGTGKSEILKSIARTGSLNKAAQELNMSYRHAWSYIKSIEKRLGRPLLIRTKGGKYGGGAILTDYARDILAKFDILDKDTKAFVDKRFNEIFSKPVEI